MLKSIQILTALNISAFLFGTAILAGESNDPTREDTQVSQMLHDRPAMAHYTARDGSIKTVGAGDAIWQAAAQGYKQKIEGAAIKWSNEPVSAETNFEAEHVVPWQGSPILLRIRNTSVNDGKAVPASFEKLWSYCIFELINATNDDQFLAIHEKAMRGELTKPEWLRLYTQLEFSALIKLRQFYLNVWVPWCEKNNVAPTSEIWLRGIPLTYTYDDWFAWYRSADSDYLTNYEKYYDQQITPYLEKLKSFHQRKAAQPR